MNTYYLVPRQDYDSPPFQQAYQAMKNGTTVQPTAHESLTNTASPAVVPPTIQYSTPDPTGFNSLTRLILDYPGLDVSQRATLLRDSLLHFINSKNAAKAEFDAGLGKLVKKVVLKANEAMAEGGG